MDESENLPLHRFLSFCRLLMFKHPRVGAGLYDIALGKGPNELGWYAIHRSGEPTPEEPAIMYMQISKEGGRLTPDKPNLPPEQIHNLYENELPDLLRSSAWQQLQTLGDLLIKQKDRVWPRKRVESTLGCIERAGVLAPMRGDDGTTDGLIEQSLQHFKSVANSAEDGITVLEFLRPMVDLVNRYLRFELTGTQAANALSYTMLRCCVSFPSPFAERTPRERVFESTRYLINRTYALLRDRNKLKLTPFYDATYLALLYGETAILNYKAYLLANEALDTVVRETMQRESFAVDELMAHNASPPLMHPMVYAPFGILETITRVRFGVIDKGGLYPGVPEPLDTKDFEGAIKAIQEYSSSASSLVIEETLENENCPASEELRQHLTGFLLTMIIGRKMP
jgi:hypothetical protein